MALEAATGGGEESEDVTGEDVETGGAARPCGELCVEEVVIPEGVLGGCVKPGAVTGGGEGEEEACGIARGCEEVES